MKTLYYDIETSPNLGYFWDIWNQNIGLNQIEEFTDVLSFAAKWQGEKNIYFASVMDIGKDEMLKLLHELMTEADVWVDYNGKKFDKPTVFREMAKLGLTKPAPAYHLDLFQEVKKTFKFTSYKLDHVLKEFGHKGKVKHQGFELWLKFMAEDPKAYEQFKKYNIGDVTSLEWLDNRLGSWIKRPNQNLYGGNGCPSCGSDRLQKRGFATTAVSTYQRYWCVKCGEWSKGAKRLIGANERAV